ERLVEAILVRHLGDLSRVGVAPGQAHRGVARDRLEDREGHQRDGHERQDHGHQPANREASHQRAMRNLARGSSAWRNPSQKTLIDMTAITSMIPGTSTL